MFYLGWQQLNYLYRQNLLSKEEGWQMDEDTVFTYYTKMIYFRETEEKQEVAK